MNKIQVGPHSISTDLINFNTYTIVNGDRIVEQWIFKNGIWKDVTKIAQARQEVKDAQKILARQERKLCLN